MIFHQMTWPEIKRVDFHNTLVLIPLGSTEQHGPHLPVNTDTLIVSRLAEAVEQAHPECVLLAPTQWLGHSPHHLSFGGTLSAGHALYTQMVVAICSSYIGMGARKIWLLNGHGGNHNPMAVALQELKNQHPDVLVAAAEYWNIARAEIEQVRESGIGGMGHACELETSLYLYLDAANVREDLIQDDGFKDKLVPSNPLFAQDMFHTGALSVVFDFNELTASGVCGKPSFASKAKGEQLFRIISAKLARMAVEIIALGSRHIAGQQ